MKKQIAGLLTGLLVCSAFLTGCSKNEATEAVKESTEDENEGTGDTKDADSKKDTNRKSDKQDSDKSDENSEESETTEAPEENLDKVGVLLPEEGEDINSSLERTELKSRLEEAGYEAAMYFAGDDSDTQAEQIRELLQDEKLKALVISPVDPYGLTDVLEEASELSIPVIDYDNLIMDTPNVKYFVTFNMRAIGKEIAKNIVEKEELDKVREDSDKSDENSEESETTEAPEENLDKVGVLLPEEGEDINSSLERTELKSRLEEAGYEAAMYFAGDDSDTQAEQIRELLQDEKLKALVISPVDPYGLTDVLEEASELSIPVIDYDNLIMDTPNVKYFVTFNMRAIGKEIAKNIVEKEELDKVREDRGARTIEFLMGSPDDDASLFLFNGIMEVLQEYIDDGTLICRSGRVTFDETSIMDQNTDTAKKQLKSEIDEFYSLEKTPDIICTASDDFALAALELLEKEQLQPGDENWPLITGVNADADAVKSVAEEKIGFTVMLDRRDLAEALTKLVETYLNGDDVDINNYSQYDNGVKIIGTVTCDGKLIDKDNYQILVDNGFYLAEMIAPEASPMPVPEEVSPTPEVTVTPEASLTPEGGEPEKKSQVIPKDEPEVSTEEVPAVKDGENQESNSKLQSSGKA